MRCAIRYATRMNRPMEPSGPASSTSADSRGNVLSKTVLHLVVGLPDLGSDYMIALPDSPRLPQLTLSLHPEP